MLLLLFTVLREIFVLKSKKQQNTLQKLANLTTIAFNCRKKLGLNKLTKNKNEHNGSATKNRHSIQTGWTI